MNKTYGFYMSNMGTDLKLIEQKLKDKPLKKSDFSKKAIVFKKMRDGLQELIKTGEIDIEKDHHGLPQVKLTPQFNKELDQLKVFQKSDLGPICLN